MSSKRRSASPKPKLLHFTVRKNQAFTLGKEERPYNPQSVTVDYLKKKKKKETDIHHWEKALQVNAATNTYWECRGTINSITYTEQAHTGHHRQIHQSSDHPSEKWRNIYPLP
ncbi:hypothetical protein AMTRI_Chr03g147310 [Amborella trichopoda]